MAGATIGLIVGGVAGELAERIQLAIDGPTGIYASQAAYFAICGMVFMALFAFDDARRDPHSWVVAVIIGTIAGGMGVFVGVETQLVKITDWTSGAGLGVFAGAVLGWIWEAMNTKTVEDDDQPGEE